MTLTNMSMLQIWGGTTCYLQIFYDTCNELGILLYYDVMHVKQKHHNPVVLLDSDVKIRCDTRSFLHHVSIILWNTYNEYYVDDEVINNVDEEMYTNLLNHYCSTRK